MQERRTRASAEGNAVSDNFGAWEVGIALAERPWSGFSGLTRQATNPASVVAKPECRQVVVNDSKGLRMPSFVTEYHIPLAKLPAMTAKSPRAC